MHPASAWFDGASNVVVSIIRVSRTSIITLSCQSYLSLDNFPEEIGGNAFLEAAAQRLYLITLCEARFPACRQLYAYLDPSA
jgi:hypothetical protein